MESLQPRISSHQSADASRRTPSACFWNATRGFLS
jgi:hypothetical protein